MPPLEQDSFSGRPLLDYATPPPERFGPAMWRSFFGWGLAYVTALAALMALQPPGVGRGLRDFRDEPAARFLIIQVLLAWAHVASNGIAVWGYWRGYRGGRPWRAFQIYVPLQSDLVLAMITLITIMMIKSPFRSISRPSPGRMNMKMVMIPRTAIASSAIFESVLSLPLLALLHPRIRRNCFDQQVLSPES